MKNDGQLNHEKLRFLYGMPYLLILGGVTLGVWFLGWESIGIPIFLVLFLLILVLIKDTTPSVPIILCSLFMISQTEWSYDLIPGYLYLAPVVIFLSMIVHVIRFRTKLCQGKMTFGIALMVVAMILSTFNTAEVTLMYGFYAMVGLLYVIVYFFYANTIEGKQTIYLLQLMVVLGTIISLEVLVFYLRAEDIEVAILLKVIDLGWGISNFVATYLIIFIPAAFYFAKIGKKPILMLLLIAFQSLMLILTLSRGGILAFGVTFVLLLIFLLKSSTWRKTLLQGFIILLGLVILALCLDNITIALWGRFIERGLDDSGRFQIYLDAISKFLEHPLFGKGILVRYEDLGEFRMYHNTILHTLASFGLVGLAGLIVQVIMTFKIIFKKVTAERWVLGIAFIGAHLHGMVDNVYYMPQFMILLFIIIAIVENANKVDATLPLAIS